MLQVAKKITSSLDNLGWKNRQYFFCKLDRVAEKMELGSTSPMFVYQQNFIYCVCFAFNGIYDPKQDNGTHIQEL